MATTIAPTTMFKVAAIYMDPTTSHAGEGEEGEKEEKYFFTS